MKTAHRWIYAVIGVPMWEWTTGQAEQSVMFFDAWGPDHSPPPMTDEDVSRLDRSLRKPTHTRIP